ncbi:MAG: TIGR02569 family protein [Nakamurella sp.]
MTRGAAARPPDGTQASVGRGPFPFDISAAQRPPEHVLLAFGAVDGQPELLTGGQGRTWLCGSTVMKPVSNPAETSWLASTFEQVQVPGIRLARPIRSSDGRWVVSGWSAQRYVSGVRAPRHEQIREAATALHEAIAGVPRPRFLSTRTDLYSWADRLAWGEIHDDTGRVGSGHGARLFAELAADRRDVRTTSQLVHGDLFNNVLFAGDASPAIIDITPYWRPVGWAVAVIAVDALAWGEAPIEIMTEWRRWRDWPELLRRALLFRLAVTLAHPLTPPGELVTMLSTAERIAPHLQ